MVRNFSEGGIKNPDALDSEATDTLDSEDQGFPLKIYILLYNIL
jgi:hypothetical protein